MMKSAEDCSLLCPEAVMEFLWWQARLDTLVSQEASLRLREQLFSQEKSLIQEQNRWLSAELESKSSEVLLVRKEKDVLQADLQGKVISRDQEVRTK